MIPFFPDLTVGYSLIYANYVTISSNTDTDSAAIDLQDYEGPVHVLGIVGNYGDASTTSVIKLRSCATSGGTYADVTGASYTLAASATANDNSTFMFKADNVAARYVEVRVTTSGGTASVPIALAVLARKKIGGGSGILTSVS